MSETNQAFRHRLQAIFADEAREHLQQIDAGLLAMEHALPGALAALAEPLLKRLHTLKGAARAVELGDLERLCHALESALLRVGASTGAPDAADFDKLHKAVSLARELTGTPTGRIRNQAGALCLQLDQLATQPAAPADAPAAINDSDEPVPALPASGASEVVRVGAGQIDAIRAEAEALLASELGLRHHAGALRALAAEMGADRRAAAVRPGDSSAAELRCAQLAQQVDAECKALAATRARLMDAILETALVPFSAILDELPALVRSLERSRGRSVRLELAGEALPVDRRVAGLLREALLHLVSNAVDHGIETPQARLAAGKDAAGVLRVELTRHDARQLLVTVSDDGAGLDLDALERAAARLGGEAALPAGDGARIALALRAGVSTREQVGPVSGRGMGLAIVADKVAAAGGELAITSARGQGSSFALRLPVYVASMRALVVQAGGQRYALALDGLDVVCALAPGDIATVGQRETMVHEGSVVPVVRLAALFGGAAAQQGQAAVALLARSAARPFALVVDAIVAEQDVLPKRLGPLLRRVRYFSGAAQLGDGALVPVLALDDLGRHGLGQAVRAPAPAAPPASARRVLVAEDSITSRLLLKHILEGAGCVVDTAVDGLDALSRLRLDRFDAVVSDVEMPQLDGLGLTAAIRANPATAELPVILVTSLQTPAERERGLQAGADAYLTKGAFDQDQLLAALRRVA